MDKCAIASETAGISLPTPANRAYSNVSAMRGAFFHPSSLASEALGIGIPAKTAKDYFGAAAAAYNGRIAGGQSSRYRGSRSDNRPPSHRTMPYKTNPIAVFDRARSRSRQTKANTRLRSLRHCSPRGNTACAPPPIAIRSSRSRPKVFLLKSTYRCINEIGFVHLALFSACGRCRRLLLASLCRGISPSHVLAPPATLLRSALLVAFFCCSDLKALISAPLAFVTGLALYCATIAEPLTSPAKTSSDPALLESLQKDLTYPILLS